MLASLAKREAAQDEARRFAIRLTRIRIEGDDLVLIRLASVPKSCASCTLSKAPFASAHNSRSEADHVFLISFSARVGFKVYSSPTEGEAVAFALGASARRLRVKTLDGVISTSPGKDGQPLPTAKVILAFDVLDPRKRRVVGRLHVRRQVNRSSRSAFHIAVAQQEHTTGQTAAASKTPVVLPLGKVTNDATKDAEDTTAEIINDDVIEGITSNEEQLLQNTRGSDDDGEEQDVSIPKDLVWSDIAQRDLARILSNYGLDINALERVIVTQHRRAVEVADPKKLVKYIEQLIGGGGAQKEIEGLTAQWMAADEEERRLDEEYDALVGKSEDLNPALQQWKRFCETNLEYHERLSTVCRKRADLLEKEATAAGKDAEVAEKLLETLEGAQEAARIKADELLGVKEQADVVASAAVEEHSASAAQHNAALENLERAQARARAASTQFKRAATTLSSTVAAVSAEDYTLQKTSKKAVAKCGAATAAAEIEVQLEKKAEELENQVAAVQEELEIFQKEILKIRDEESNDGGISKEVLTARAAWKKTQERANAAAEIAQTAAQKSSQANLGASDALSHLKYHEKVEHGAQKAVQKCNFSITSLEKSLLALENEEKKARHKAEAAENELAAHQIEGMKLEKALQKTFQALEDAGIDVEDSNYQPRNNKIGGDRKSCETTRQSVDAAVVALAQQAQHDELNPLTGAFHGRIHSVLRVLSPEAINAANAVLLEKCNPVSAMVTSTRTAAEAVVGYFKENKVGVTSCTVLEELRGSTKKYNSIANNNSKAPENSAAAATAAVAASQMLAPVLNKTPGAICPLSPLIQNNTSIAGSSLLSSDVYDTWYLVSDPLSASKIIEQERKKATSAAAGGGGGGGPRNPKKKKIQKKQRHRPPQQRNIVTLCGSLFKCDGEICAPKEDAFLRLKHKYLLGSDYVDIGSSGSLNPSSKSKDVEYEQMVEKLRAEYASAVTALEEQECSTNTINERTAAAHAAFAFKHAAIAATKSKVEAVLKTMQKEAKALHFAQAAVEKAHQSHNAAAAKAKHLHTTCLESEALAKQRLEESERLHQVYVNAAQGEPEAQQALNAELAVADLRHRRDHAEKHKLTLQTDLASIQKSMQRLSKAIEALTTAEKGATECAHNVSEATLAVAAAEVTMERALHAKEKAITAKKIATDNWREAVVHHQAALQAHQHTLATIQNARTRQQSALRKAVDISKESREAMLQVNAINAQLNSAGAALRGVPPSTAEEKSNERAVAVKEADDIDDAVNRELEYCSSTSSSDVENEQIAAKRRRRGTIAAVHGGGARGGAELKPKTAEAAKNQPENNLEENSSSDEALSIEPMETSSDASECEWEEDEVTSALAELAKQKRALENLALNLDTAAATEAMHVYSQLIQLQATLQEQDNRVQRLCTQLAEARTARYARFSTAMDAAAVHLSKIYQRLTGNIGDASCLYSQDENSVFEEGVKFKVRPDSGQWRMFASLSGGQQALAALSLCFALQKVAPSPFYFFDEIDAALDTTNSQRVADFLRDSCESDYSLEDGMAPQIIAVSHRTPPQEAAHCLLAVYPIDSSDIYNNNTNNDNNNNKSAASAPTTNNGSGESTKTGIMTLYPTFHQDKYNLHCQGSKKMLSVRLDDVGRMCALEEEEEIREGDVEGVDYEFINQLSQMLQNIFSLDMQHAHDKSEGETKM
ncbi:hypothetical protein KSW81_004172 [Nannochloris sp. 'desiccata']|nr:hypothetical protein KSW81_004172 [Chlorella desiccata (nom. nud.)]